MLLRALHDPTIKREILFPDPTFPQFKSIGEVLADIIAKKKPIV
jgi:hypothetical protein